MHDRYANIEVAYLTTHGSIRRSGDPDNEPSTELTRAAPAGLSLTFRAPISMRAIRSGGAVAGRFAQAR
jgi:hypothetical protein